jgi:hypothetical protein
MIDKHTKTRNIPYCTATGGAKRHYNNFPQNTAKMLALTIGREGRSITALE